MIFDDMLRQAFDEAEKERAEHSRKVYKKHRFSLAFKLWEFKTLRNLKKNRYDSRWTLRKARCIVAAMTVAASLIIGGTAYAAIAGRFRFKDKVDYSKVLMETHPSDKTVIEEYYGLPEEDGWELTDYDIVYFSSTLNYKRGDTRVSFDQMLIHEGTMGNISTDRAKVEMLSLYEENDGFLLNFGNNETLIYWIYDGYLFNLSGNINKNEAIKLVYSTKIIDFPKKS